MFLKLSSICNITMGASPRSIYYNSSGVGLPFIQGCNAFGYMYPIIDSYTSHWFKTAKQNDILFTVRAPVGEVNIATEQLAIGRGLASLTPIGCSTKYLYYLLYSNKDSFKKSSVGTIYESINKNELASIELNVHSNAEQQHIVDTICNKFLIVLFILPPIF